MNLSFCGCGFLGVYQLGVLKALINQGPRLLSQVDRVAGASAGALVATTLVCNPTKWTDCKDFSLDLSRQVRSIRLGAMNPNFNLLHPIEEFLTSFLPEDSYKIASGTLYISVTSIRQRRLRHELVSQFTSNQQLIETLLMSCSIPLYTGLKMPRKNDIMYFDGGFSNNLYKFDEGRTITISPFAGDMDIAPTDDLKYNFDVTVANMKVKVNELNVARAINGFHPPNEIRMQNYFDRGFIDCINFLKDEDLFDKFTKDKDESSL